jgi:serine/threonine protein kinase/tetratricopeptide (TPR) repeat protein
MDSRRWTIAKEIFHSALKLPLEQRSGFVEAAVGGDVEVLAEVSHLLSADAAVDSAYLESPLIQTYWGPPLHPGDILCERFRIERFLDGGGMGFVYEALDMELRVRVALKVIRPELSAGQESLERFRREVRLARRITHPNICRTFDLERAVHPVLSSGGVPIDVIFLTMEFIEGPTLAARLSGRDALPVDEALHLAREVAEALHAAHSLGIVHRDIKPANIILDLTRTPARAVVTDFGLARANDPVGADGSRNQSRSDWQIGSPPYMAPEQILGGKATTATDIYAFGLVLYEMVTGCRAFPSDDPLSVIRERLSHSGLPDSADRSLLNPNWAAAIDRCLSLEPKDRFADALDVAEALRNPNPVPTQALDSGFRRDRVARARQFSFRNGLSSIILAVLLILMSAFLWRLRYYRADVEAKVTPGALVYMAPVQNQTGEKAFDSVTNLIEAGLTQSVQVNLLDRTRAEDILREMKQTANSAINPATAREVAMRSGAARVVFVTLSKTSEAYRLEVDLQEPDNAPTRYRRHWTRDWTWSPTPDGSANSIEAETAATMREASAWIRTKAGESANDIARFDAPPEEATTTSWQALADFDEGERLFAQGKRQEAIVFLQSAIRRDPQFALAEASEGDILANLGQTQAAYDIYQKALETGSTGRLTLRERDRILGIIAHDTWDELAAEAAYREYTLFYRHDYDAWFRRARPLLMLGRPQDSLNALEQAHQADPSKPAPLVQLVRVELVLGDANGAARWLRELEQHYPRDWYLFALGPAQFIRHDYGDAAESFSAMTHSQNETLRKVGYTLLASLRAEQGSYAEAVDIESQAIARDPGDPDEVMHRAAMLCQLGRVQACVADLEQALKLDPGPRLLVTASEILGHLAASGGDNASLARRELAFLQKCLSAQRYGLVSDIAQHRVLGETYLAENKPGAAVAEFRKADALDAPYKPRDYLARALVALAAQTSRHASADRLLEEAAKLYGSVALHPMVVWYFPIPYLPGAYADETESWLRLERQLARPEVDVHTVAQNLAELRQ